MANWDKLIKQYEEKQGITTETTSGSSNVSTTSAQNNFDKNFGGLKELNQELYAKISSEFYVNVKVLIKNKELIDYISIECINLKPYLYQDINLPYKDLNNKKTFSFIFQLNEIAFDFKKNKNVLKTKNSLKKLNSNYFNEYFLSPKLKKYETVDYLYTKQFNTYQNLDTFYSINIIPAFILLLFSYLSIKYLKRIIHINKRESNGKRTINISLKDIQLYVACLFLCLSLNYTLELYHSKRLKKTVFMNAIELQDDHTFQEYPFNSFYNSFQVYSHDLNIKINSNWRGLKIINNKEIDRNITNLLLISIYKNFFYSFIHSLLIFSFIKIIKYIRLKIQFKIVD